MACKASARRRSAKNAQNAKAMIANLNAQSQRRKNLLHPRSRIEPASELKPNLNRPERCLREGARRNSIEPEREFTLVSFDVKGKYTICVVQGNNRFYI
jgi:hypothetical protein